MPAKSKAQRKLMGMALAYKRGDLKSASNTIKDLADSMSEEDLEKFAKTKEDDLPEKIKKDENMTTLKQLIEAEFSLNANYKKIQNIQKELQKNIISIAKDLNKNGEKQKALKLQELYKNYGIELFIKINQLLEK